MLEFIRRLFKNTKKYSKDYENDNIPFERLVLPSNEEELKRYIDRSDREVSTIKRKWGI